MPTIVADRFIAHGASWIDLATGSAIHLHVTTAATRTDEVAWAERCAAVARLRHPMINPLADYGALDSGRLFEAYAIREPLAVTTAMRQRLIGEAVRFLQWHGAALVAETAPLAMRQTIARPLSVARRAIGVVLQPRGVMAGLVDVLDGGPAIGASTVQIVGPPSSGLRTVRALAAREARIRGYVPVAAAVALRVPRLVEALVDRHVCVLADGGGPASERAALAALLPRLGRASTRRHVVLVFGRSAAPRPASAWSVLHLEPMGVTAMAAMVFVDTQGPAPAELFDAARGAQGRPGLFLARLGAEAFEGHVSRSLVVREATQIYAADGPPPAPVHSPAPQRSSGVLARAAERGEALARRGRHLAAIRLLARAARVLERRGDAAAAARCAECLGRVHLERGRPRPAIEQFERARVLAPEGSTGLGAALGIGVALTEDARPLEAEALLRSVLAAAVVHGNPDPSIAAALGDSLYWQGRYAEAVAVVHRHLEDGPACDPRCQALAARALLAEGDVTAALRHARAAVQDARAEHGPATLAIAHRVLALALASAGDAAAAEQHVRHALAAAGRARLPIEALRGRIALLAVLSASSGRRTQAQALADRLLTSSRRETVPKLVRIEMTHAFEELRGHPDSGAMAVMQQQYGVRVSSLARSPAGRTAAVSDLESLMELCHAATDDRDALDRLCAAAADRVRAAAVAIVAAQDRRMIGHSGRPWNADSVVLTRVLTTGAAVPPAPDGSFEAAEPVKYAGEVVGAIVCRWTPGTDVCVERAAPVIKAAALAAAAPVRATLDRSVSASTSPGWTDLIGESATASALRASTARAARSPFPVLIEGESGSGKELVARAIHRLGPRRDRRFCAVNCAALTDDLLESELFGHVRGAFTGAVGDRVGLLEEADGGTLFLDEIGELSPRGQAKLLRVIQEGEIRRVGESFARRVDVRFVAATNRHLEEEAAAGRFRQDLRFRLDVVRIVVPPLRERSGDIPRLAVHFWNEAAQRVGSRATLAPDTLAALSRYDWPGNVRELQNVIAWLAVHAPVRGRIGAGALPAGVAAVAADDGLTFEAAREEFERRFLRSALARANGHRAKAAESLGLTRQGLAKMLRRLNVDDRPSA